MYDESMGIGVAIVGVVYLAFIILFIVAYWKIWSKAGFNGAWSLLMLVPLVNLIAFLYLAFAKWPIHGRISNPDTFR
ncbi:MAG: hypothetical protein ACK46Q_04660 [Hyphomonas sp.]